MDHNRNYITYPWWIISVSGIFAGAVTAVFVAPLDLVRTQQMALTRSSSAWKVLNNVFATEGFYGLFRGIVPSLFGLPPTWMFYWSFYTFGKRHLAEVWKYDINATSVHLCSAFLAGILTALFSNPLWVIKTRIQTKILFSKNISSYSILGTTKSIYLSEGIAGFYRGLAPSLIGVTHVCIQFPIYEKSKLHFAHWQNKTPDQLSPKDIAICSMISKFFASIAAFPHEVLRVRQQIENTTLLNTLSLTKLIYKESGIFGFYRGLSTNLIKTVPACAINFVSFEFMKRILMTQSERTQIKKEVKSSIDNNDH